MYLASSAGAQGQEVMLPKAAPTSPKAWAKGDVLALVAVVIKVHLHRHHTCRGVSPEALSKPNLVICTDFHDPRKGCKGRKCTKLHDCPKILANGEMCGKDHKQFDHV